MTVERREILYTPTVDPRSHRIYATVRAAHGAELSTLATDAATGHPGQLLRWGREESGDTVRSLFYQPIDAVRFLRVRAYIGRPHAGTLGAYVKLELRITDGTTTVQVGGTGDAEIPAGFRGTERHAAPLVAAARLDAVQEVSAFLDCDALRTAGLSSTDSWRFELRSDRDTTTGVWVERVTIEEVPRFVVDSSEALGALVGSCTPRAPILDGTLSRIQATVDGAVESSLRTYHCCASAEGAPLVGQNDTSWASLAGYEEDVSSHTPLTFVVRGRKAVDASQSRFRWRVRYRIDDVASDADVRVRTGEGDYEIALPDTSGSWADSSVGEGYLGTGEDYMRFESKLDDAGATLQIATITVWEYPET